MTDKYERRSFIKKLLGGSAAAITLPSIGWTNRNRFDQFPKFKEWTQPEEDYWALVKNQYQIKPGLIMMNAANFCPSPYPVSHAMADHLDSLNSNASSQDRKKYHAIYDETVNLLADYLGAQPEEIAITRNTSESNNMINNGLDLKPADEVIYWEQNHQTLNIAWEVRAKRAGFKIIKVSTPRSPENEEDLIRPFTDVMTKKTRLICFSHISNISGTLLPVQRLCAIARDKGILSLVDGAQTFGFMNVDLEELGCDFYTGSAHKWLTGPKESGVLYVKKNQLNKVWPLVISKDWTWGNEWKIENLVRYGQRNDATIAAFGKAVEFHNMIGKDKVEARVRELATSLKDKLSMTLREIEFVTPENAKMNACILVFNLPGIDSDTAVARLYSDYKIAAAGTHDGFNGIRLSPNIYNTKEELDQVVKALRELKI
ncbi:aminotransferase class V-fold PLP-dependent enzyme [Fulvivirga sp. M361]|uniref:aminotransferase class V-fold PLP-dependent enzyme n=1 Tax=Fulvivirga sp. M361 TaxID=2594266 RepID=UPI001625EA52|nr:aminotransferase class V-fold PLP-dependent enzyme [Fulvivirga sp. M361]